MSRKIDLLVIGGGPAGYSSAIRASQLGKKVVLAEKGSLGGTCLNRGCIPTKALLESAAFYRNLDSAAEHGVSLKLGGFDYHQVAAKKDKIVKRLVNGLGFLLKQRKIEIISGEAVFDSARQVRVGQDVFEPEKIVVSTGTASVELPGLKPDGKFVLDSDQMLAATELPRSLLIVGGGVIGCEFATIFSSFGVEVTIVELMDRLLPPEDQEISRALLREFKKRKIKVLTGSSVQSLERLGEEVRVEVSRGEKRQEITAERVLVSVGRNPVIPQGFPGELTARGYIKVDDSLRTTVDHIYAAGDVIGGLQLAHLAFEEGLAAAGSAFEKTEDQKQWFVPSCVYTQPEIGSVGLTEEEARQKYGEVTVGKYSLKGNGKAVIMDDDAGFFKIVASPDGIIRGVHLIGPQATELIVQAAIILEKNLTLADWAQVIYPHPTVSEAVKETVWSSLGIGLHSI
ncbi:MAG: dihydrolipoyl dehydrogenase [Firmicutes bacterium]|nr:dihydrolipoyl dehydrogenase [Bacillota bacterium]